MEGVESLSKSIMYLLKAENRIRSFWEDRQSPQLKAGEESPDFTGEGASERLGAERLRKVQQKIFRAPQGATG